jgi:hypothetical protein
MTHLRVPVRALADAKPTPTFGRGCDLRSMAKRTRLAKNVVRADDMVNVGSSLAGVATEDALTKCTIFFVCSVTFFYNFDAIGPYLTLYFLKYTNSSNVGISQLLY